MFMPSPSSSVYFVLPSVQEERLNYRYGQQDHHTFGYRMDCPLKALIWLHFQSFLRNLTPKKVDLCDALPSVYSPRLASYTAQQIKSVISV